MIEQLKNDPWFKRNYVVVRHREEEEVNLDDISAVFDDIEVTNFIYPIVTNDLPSLTRRYQTWDHEP